MGTTKRYDMIGRAEAQARATAEADADARGGPGRDEMAQCLSHLEVQLRRAYFESTRALVATVEARDPYTHRHSTRVAQISRCIAHRLGLAARQIECIAMAARLHDIGKIGVPDAILSKPGPLTPDEFEVVKHHPAIGVQILGHTTYLRDELPIILHHHERVDGRGYPDGLTGDDIPIGARVLAVADALDTMLSRRSYRAPLDFETARGELIACRGRQFDPFVVDAALAWIDDPDDHLAVEFRANAWAD